jgi:soluble lytic murein transglycosylase-like protein
MTYQPLIATIAAAFDLPPTLLEALVQVESAGDPHAYRYEPAFWDRYLRTNPQYRDQDPEVVSASYGLLQVMYPVACELGFRGAPPLLFEPAIGLLYGATKLAQLRASLGSEDAAVCAYNGGTAGNQHPPFRNQAYLDKVRAARAALP